MSQSDMADELSRQLEDILSTYCRESEDAGALLNGQSHSLVLNGLNCEKEHEKSEDSKVNGGHKSEKEQKKTQEKKKVKGLGEDKMTLSVFKQFCSSKDGSDATSGFLLKGRRSPF